VTLEDPRWVWFFNSEKDQGNRILAVQNLLISKIAKMSQGLDHVVNYFAMHLDDVVNGMNMRASNLVCFFHRYHLLLAVQKPLLFNIDINFFWYPVFNYWEPVPYSLLPKIWTNILWLGKSKLCFKIYFLQ